MVESVSNTIVKIVALSYLCVLIIEAHNLTPSHHYFSLSVLSFFLVIISCQYKDPRLIGYAVLNYTLLSAYIPLIIYDNPFVSYWLYGKGINFATIYETYEIALLISGGGNALVVIINRAVNATRQCYNRWKITLWSL